jgi:hypothetical protein
MRYELADQIPEWGSFRRTDFLQSSYNGELIHSDGVTQRERVVALNDPIRYEAGFYGSLAWTRITVRLGISSPGCLCRLGRKRQPQ